MTRPILPVRPTLIEGASAMTVPWVLTTVGHVRTRAMQASGPGCGTG
jgi:hypothetical protein